MMMARSRTPRTPRAHVGVELVTVVQRAAPVAVVWDRVGHGQRLDPRRRASEVVGGLLLRQPRSVDRGRLVLARTTW